MAERYLLLEQPRGRERSIRLSLATSGQAQRWNVKRTTLHGEGKGSATEVLERDATLAIAEQRYEFFTRNYLERGWYPPQGQHLDKRDLITRFVNRWPALPRVLRYDAGTMAQDAHAYVQDVPVASAGLRHYRRGRRVLVRVGVDHAVVLSDVDGLRGTAPVWLTQALAALDAGTLPAIFEARLYDDALALSDLLLAKSDVRALPFSARWTRLQALLAASPTLDTTQVQLDPLNDVSDLAQQVTSAMAQGYDEVVVSDRRQPYHYGLSPERGGMVAWESFG
jgi:hypothetical protein